MGNQLETSRILRLADAAVPGGKLTVELQRDAELLNAIDSPAGRVERKVKRPALGPAEQNSLVEGSGGLEDADDGAGRRVHDEPRDDPGLFVVKVETEKELTFPDGASSGEKRLLTERRTGEGEGPQRARRSVRGSAGQGRSRAPRKNQE